MDKKRGILGELLQNLKIIGIFIIIFSILYYWVTEIGNVFKKIFKDCLKYPQLIFIYSVVILLVGVFCYYYFNLVFSTFE